MANTSDVNQRSADVDFRASIEDFAVEFSVESVAESLGIDEESIDQRDRGGAAVLGGFPDAPSGCRHGLDLRWGLLVHGFLSARCSQLRMVVLRADALGQEQDGQHLSVCRFVHLRFGAVFFHACGRQ